MLIDIIAFALLLFALFKGWRKGLIIALFSFVAFFIGLAAALKLSSLAATYIGTYSTLSQRWLPVVAFLAVFILVSLLVTMGAKMLEGIVKMAMLGWVNKLGGIIFYTLLYFFIFSILLFYANNLHLIKSETIQASVTYPYIKPLAVKAMHAIGSVIPFFKNMFDELLRFFEHVSNKNEAA